MIVVPLAALKPARLSTRYQGPDESRLLGDSPQGCWGWGGVGRVEGLIHQWKRGRGTEFVQVTDRKSGEGAHGESGARRNWYLPLFLASSCSHLCSLHFLSPGRKGGSSGTMGIQEGCMEEVTSEGKFNLMSASPTRMLSFCLPLGSSGVLSP